MKGFVRPEITVLSESSEVPEGHVVEPPEEFTHELVRDAAYGYDEPAPAQMTPARTLPAGTKVRLVAEDGDSRHVVDPRGLMVMIDKDALRKL
ncbi:MAG TPA: hypothetical protein VGD79_09625 [Thermoanaerobaculia bacterium]|jgi:hypothetical protein